MSTTLFPGQQESPDVSVGHARATDALGAIVTVITAEQGRKSHGSGNSSMPTIQQTHAVKCTISGPTRIAGLTPQNKAMDTLGVMIVVVPVVRTTGLGAL